MRLFQILSLVFSLLLWAGASTAQPFDAGAVGGACLDADTPCLQGICNTDIGLCVPCGMPGQAACQTETGGYSCNLAGLGFSPRIAGGGKLPICVSSASADCGEVGLAACLRDGALTCYRGTLVGTSCAACGDIGQACCADTAYACDYGTCHGGTCLPKPVSAQDQIINAIDDCQFSEAQNLIAALPAGTTYLAEVQAALVAALDRESQVLDLLNTANGLSSSARSHLFANDHGNAALDFHAALARLRLALELTKCPSNRNVLENAITAAEQNIEQAQSGVALAQAQAAIDFCLFDTARTILAEIPSPNAQRDALAARTTEIVATESRVQGVVIEGWALNNTGDQQLANGQYEHALASYNAAHDMFMRARQLTNCPDIRSAMDDALALAGRNILLADEGPAEVSDQPVTPGIPITGSDTMHPCLDLLSAPADYYVSGYQRGLGGGGTFWLMYGQYICGMGGQFSTLNEAELVAYSCDRDGNQYTNCRVTNRNLVESWDVEDGTITYHFDGGDYWIVLTPAE